MNTKSYLLLLLLFALFQSCSGQQSQTELPKVENHLTGELDYTHEALALVQKQVNGEDISLGEITTDGTIHFNLPEYNIKALYESVNLENYKLQSWFSIDSRCKDRDVFAKTPYDDVYALKTKAIWIKKYGIYVSILETKSNKKKLKNKNASRDSLAIVNEYFWFYIDRAITYKDDCSKVSLSTGEIDVSINTDIEFDKGWNFMEETTEWTLDDIKSNVNTSQSRKIQFTKSSPSAKNVKWSLRQVVNDEKIQTAKKLYNLIPITKNQFEKWAPNKLGDLKVTTKEHGNPPEGEKNKNNMHLIYANKDGNQEIELYVIDAANSPDDMEMINFAYAMENEGKDEKDIKPYVGQFNEQEKVTQLLYKIEDRIIINAAGTGINTEDLWDYIQKLNVDKLLKYEN